MCNVQQQQVDLFDGKDLGVVVQCLHSLGSTLQAKHPAFGGPHLGVRTATANKRNFTADQVCGRRKDPGGSRAWC